MVRSSVFLLRYELMRKRLLKIAIAVFGIPLLVVAVVYQFFPARAVAAMTFALSKSAGLSSATTTVEGYAIPYYQGGSGPPLVLLHGFGDNKVSFLQTARFLSEHYTLYLPDLPGHGAAAQDPNRKYGVEAHVQAIRGFTQALGLSRFYLAGNSMGGHVAAAFAFTYPEVVQKLILLDPAGLAVDGFVTYPDAPEPMDTEAKYDAFMNQAFVRRPWVPEPMKKDIIAMNIRNFQWLNRMAGDLRSDNFAALDKRIGEIKAPTLIVWGDGDKIIPVSHAPVWHKGIPQSQLTMLEHCGHGPQYERPEETARLIREFLSAP